MQKAQGSLILKLFFIFLVAVVTSSASANYARFLNDDSEALLGRLHIIDAAQSEILVEYFSVWDDAVSVEFLAHLKKAAGRGVKVKIILEHLATTAPESMMAALKSENLQVRHYNPLSPNLAKATFRDHAKLIIIDGKTLLTGGRNIGNSYFGLDKKLNYRDLDILLQGPVAAKARANFMEVWQSPLAVDTSLTSQFYKSLDPLSCISVDDFASCQQMNKAATNEVKRQSVRLARAQQAADAAVNVFQNNTRNYEWIGEVRFLSHKPDQLVNSKRAYLDHELNALLSKAQERVEIATPWFIPTDELFLTLRNLKARGVDVKIITNSMKSTDTTHAHAAYLTKKAEYMAAGFEIYEYLGPWTLHTKAALIDGKTIFIGTYNIDPRSAFLNREIGVVFQTRRDSGLSKQLADIFADYRKSSLLTVKGGKEWNKDLQEKDVSLDRKAKVEAFKVIAPLIINQL